jgi:ankyrin repeat protein
MRSASLESNLLKAIAANHTIISEHLIKKGADITYNNGAALKAAVEVQNLQLVKELLEQDADPNTTIDEDGKTVLMLAASLNNLELVKLLIDYHADWRVTIYDKCAQSYMTADDYTDSIAIKTYLEEEEQYQLELDAELVQAIKKGNNDAIQDLINKEADVDSGEGKQRPLYTAIESKNLDAVTLLIEAGAKTYHNADDEPSFLHAAVNEEAFLIAEILLAKNTPVNVMFDGQTPLHWAVMKGSLRMVELLLANGADATIKDATGKTPIDYALHDKIEALVKENYNAIEEAHKKAEHDRLAVEQKAREKQEFIDGFVDAIRHGDEAKVELCLKQGADLKLKGSVDQSLLVEAVLANKANMVKLLLSKGLNPNDRDALGHTASYYAQTAEIKKLIGKAKKNVQKEEL